MGHYGTACIDLCKEQKSLNMNANPHPQDYPVFNVLFNSVKMDESKKRQENHDVRGICTIQDGYSSMEESTRIENYFLAGHSSSSSHCLAMFLLTHFCLTRQESVKKLKLAEILIVDIENEGSPACKAMIIIMEQGNFNQFD